MIALFVDWFAETQSEWRQLLAPMLRRSNMFQLFEPIANWVWQRHPPAGGQQRALCCCGAWSRARWRGGCWRPRPAAAGESRRSAFGLQRAQTGEAGVRGRRPGLQSHRKEEEEVVEQLVMWRQQGASKFDPVLTIYKQPPWTGKSATRSSANSLILIWVDTEQIFSSCSLDEDEDCYPDSWQSYPIIFSSLIGRLQVFNFTDRPVDPSCNIF